MSRLIELMSEFKRLKTELRSTESQMARSRLVASLMTIKGQHREHNNMLIKRRKYAERWREQNRSEVSRYNREYARMRRKKNA
mgnify:CR=1 FL=1|tara:strand:+ start:1060 stop:1308 length:249 start_codon:yes stop_codon:yes gene_type:complete